MGVLVHVGSSRLTKCPACGKTSIMNNFVTDPITWPAPERQDQVKPLSEEELKQKRVEESKYEDSSSS